MARTKTDKAKRPTGAGESRRGGEITGLGLVALAVGLSLAIFSFSPADLEPNAEVGNLIGPVGAYTADIMLYIFGAGALLLLVVMVLLGGFMMLGKRPELKPSEFVGYGLFVFSGAVLCHLVFHDELLLGHGAGGLVGELLGDFLIMLIGRAGTYIFSISLGLLALMLVTDLSLGGLLVKIGALSREAWAAASVRLTDYRERRRERQLERASLAEFEVDDTDTTDVGSDTKPAKKKTRRRKLKSSDEAEIEIDKLDAPAALPAIADSGPWSFGDEDVETADAEPRHDPDVRPEPEPGAARKMDSIPVEIERPPAGSDGIAGLKIVESDGQRKARERAEVLAANTSPEPLRRPVGDFELPPVSFLNFVAPENVEVDTGRLQGMAAKLLETLAHFSVQGEIVRILPGPVITMFEFLPAPGIKLSKIAGLTDDIAMGLSALSVRIIAPIPGKGVVGIEIPNDNREIVYLKEIIADDVFQKSQAKMPMALGKATDGEPVVADLAKMPHLLVAGATGSGKSVAVNTMIVSLLYRYTPEEVRLIMVDPKMLEFSIYEGIPHLLLPVVTDPKKAAIALRWAVEEMERRYALLADLNVRNLDNYNRRVGILTKEAELDIEKGLETSESGEKLGLERSGSAKHEKLPRIVCIIDEFADLMMVASKEVETSVARLAQKARAAGIHVILATQRPSVDVITGLIKANFPTRIALRVAQRTDSRTILDSNGAEHLLGRGDMLFLPPGSSAQQRVHGAFVSEEEIDKLVAFLKAQGEPLYDDSLLSFGEGETETPNAEPEEYDEHYDSAVFIVTTERQASISMVQRKLRVGYNRAARMIERMESDGIVGPADGSKPRQVLAPPPVS